MRLFCWFLLLLGTFALGTKPEQKWIYTMEGKKPLVGTPVETIDQSLDSFNNFFTIHTYAAPFNPWKDHTDTVFWSLTKVHLRIFISWAAGRDTIVADPPNFTYGEKQSLGRIVELMTSQDIFALRSAEGLALLYYLFKDKLLSKLPRESIITITGKQVKYLLSRLITDCRESPDLAECLKVLTDFPDQMIAHYSMLIVNELNHVLSQVPSDFFKKLVQNKKVCSHLEPTTLACCLSQRQLATAFSPECVAQMDFEENSIYINELSSQQLSMYHKGFSEASIKGIGARLQGYASQVHINYLPGSALNLQSLSSTVLQNLSTTVLQSNLYSHFEKPGLVFGDQGKNIKVSTFTAYSSNDLYRALLSLTDVDIENLSFEVVQHIISKAPLLCSKLLPSNITRTLQVEKIECFNAMPGPTQAAAIVLAESIPELSFKFLSEKDINEWQFADHYGLAVLKIRKNLFSNVNNMISHLGESPRGENPCKLLRDSSLVSSLPLLMDNISLNCILNSGLEFCSKRTKGTKRLHVLQDFLLQRGRFDEDYITSLDEGAFAIILKETNFCQTVPDKSFKLLSPNLFKLIDGNCLKDLEMINYLHSKIIKTIKSVSFRALSFSDIEPETLPKLSPQQMLAVGKNPTSKDDSTLASVLTKDNIGKFSLDQIRIISEDEWARCLPTVFAGLNVLETFRAIDPIKMRSWNLEQIKQIPINTWKGLSVTQAKAIGCKRDNSESYAIVNFIRKTDFENLNDDEGLNDDVRDALNVRALVEKVKANEVILGPIRLLVLGFLVVLLFSIPIVVILMKRKISQLRHESHGNIP